MKDHIAEYFQNPKNVKGNYIHSCSLEINYTPNEFYDLTPYEQDGKFIVMKGIICEDNFFMSVQGSSEVSCSPRATERSKHYCSYTRFEVGYPSEKEELLIPYMDSTYMDSIRDIYPQVPRKTINEIIEKHGGLKIHV